MVRSLLEAASDKFSFIFILYFLSSSLSSSSRRAVLFLDSTDNQCSMFKRTDLLSSTSRQ